MCWQIAVHQTGCLSTASGSGQTPASGGHPVVPSIQPHPAHLCAPTGCTPGPPADTGGSMAWCSRSVPAVLCSFQSLGLGPVDLWALVPENPPWPHSPGAHAGPRGQWGQGEGGLPRPLTHDILTISSLTYSWSSTITISLANTLSIYPFFFILFS